MSAVSVLAVRKMMGMSRQASELLMRWQVSKPSSSGIITSSRMRSGRIFVSASSACLPLVATLS